MRPGTCSLCALGCLVLLLAGPGAGQTFFEEVTREIGVPLLPARSVASADYDNDGWPDVFLAEDFRSGGQIALLHNQGHGRFEDRTASLHLDAFPTRKSGGGGGAIFGDYDNDGDLDLFVPVGGFQEHGMNRLLCNDRGVFREVTLAAGLTDSLPTDNAISLPEPRGWHLCRSDLPVGYSRSIVDHVFSRL